MENLLVVSHKTDNKKMQFKKNKKIIISVLVIILLVGINFGVKMYVTEETRCSSDEDCKDFGCTDDVGKSIPKCDSDTETCYCGGECGDGYCNSYEESPKTCPEDCLIEDLINCKELYGDAYWCSDYAGWKKECEGRGEPKKIEGLCNIDGQDYCVTCREEAKLADCKELYGEGYWCGDVADWAQCGGKGYVKELTKACNEKGDTTCITCVEEKLINCKELYGDAYWCSDYAGWKEECKGKGDFKKIEGACNTDGQDHCVTCIEEKVPFSEKKCSSCGEGLICDEEECNKLGDCVYKDGLIGGKCLEAVEIELVMIDDKSIKDDQELTMEDEFFYTLKIKCNKPEGCGNVYVDLKAKI